MPSDFKAAPRVEDKELLRRLHGSWRHCILQDALHPDAAFGPPGLSTRLSLHHVHKHPRDDRIDNLVMLCGDGTTGCHGKVESGNREALLALAGVILRQRPDVLRYLRGRLGTVSAAEWIRCSLVREAAPLMVGECPSATGETFHAYPLSGAPARRLMKVAGLQASYAELGFWTMHLYARFETRNLFPHHQPKWSAPAASARALLLPADRDLVLLGKRVAVAVLGKDAQLNTVTVQNGRTVTCIPHPSGRNRTLNSLEGLQALRRSLRAAMPTMLRP